MPGAGQAAGALLMEAKPGQVVYVGTMYVCRSTGAFTPPERAAGARYWGYSSPVTGRYDGDKPSGPRASGD